MLIHVTQSHIDRGCRCDGENCPVKHAITDATGIERVVVAEDFITFDPGIDGFSVRTPRAVAIWIRRYDQSEMVEPFEFDLDVEGLDVEGVE